VKEEDLGYGHVVMGFESLEEMQEYMDSREREANENTMPKQWEITWGSYVIKVVPPDLIIWGYVFTEEEFLADEIGEDLGNPQVEAEVMASLEQLKGRYERGYRYGRYYSVITPKGEYGDAHVSELWEITEADYVFAMANKWEVAPELVRRLQQEILESVTEQESE